MKIENKISIVTGGASGLGEATVKRLIDLKAKVNLWNKQVVIADINENFG